MNLDMRKEQFSRAYVQAVAACAGFSWSIPSVDEDSIDLTLHRRGGGGTIRSPRLDLQLKCTAGQPSPKNVLSYSLKLKNYDDLRAVDVLVPRILVVVIVPEKLADWIEQSPQSLVLRHCAYWSSIRGMNESKNASSQTIDLPSTQVFGVQSLTDIMARVGNGGLP